MKKITLVVLIVFSIQNLVAQKTVFGIKGGANITLVTGQYDYIDFNYKIGFQVGGFAEVTLSDYFILKPELLYSLQGTQYYNPITRDFKKSNEHYIILPLLVKYDFLEKFSVELGPQFDYLISLNLPISDEELDAILDNYTSLYWGIDLGIGYDFTTNIGLELRYNYRFDKNKEKDFSYVNKYNDSVLQLNLEYRFN